MTQRLNEHDQQLGVGVPAFAAVPCEASAPDWDKVPFDVGCARCGHDLRGLDAPVCPKCKLEFDWAEAVPIEELICARCHYHLYGLTETRCPECGEPFNWDDALAEYHRRQKPLFEYQWRRRPVRSFIDTWKSTLRPGRFWARMSIHDPPHIPALLAMIAGCFAASIIVWIPLQAIAGWVWDWRWYTLSRFRQARWRPWDAVVKNCRDSLTDSTIYVTLGYAAVWALASLAALMIFRQSMRRYRVRTAHVTRVWAYAVPMMLPLAVILPFVPLFVTGMWGWPADPVFLHHWFLFLVPYVIWSIHFAYRDYLHMRHSLAVAISTQMIAVMATLVICDLVFARGYTAALLIEFDKCFGLPGF